MTVGTQSKNTVRYIRIDQARKKFGSSLCNALPTFMILQGETLQRHLKGKKKLHLLNC